MEKTHFSAIALLLTIFLYCSCVFAVSTVKIDAIRNKETLTDSDTEVIEAFLAEAFEELLAKTDFSDIGPLRNTIVSKSSSVFESGQFQYGPRFTTAFQKQMSQALGKISKMPDDQYKQLMTMNLLILINDMGNVELSKTALDYLQNPDVMIRYWAVSCLTNSDVLGQLNMTESAAGSRLAEQFAQKLQTAAQTEKSGDIIILLAQFAAGLNQPAANEILKEIVRNRVNFYLDWQVNDEMTEIRILKALADRAGNYKENTSVMAKNFAVLYSLAIQRYILGQETLPAGNIRNLVSVILQGEKYLLQILPDRQGSFKRAIEKGGGQLLQTEHDSLLGSANTTGRLPTTAGFDYGKNPNGSAKTTPPTLQKPPQAEKDPENEPQETAAEPNL